MEMGHLNGMQPSLMLLSPNVRCESLLAYILQPIIWYILTFSVHAAPIVPQIINNNIDSAQENRAGSLWQKEREALTLAS